MIDISELDEKDNKILNVIENDARLTYSEIGERVGLSRVAVKARMDALETKGVICGYKTVINQKAVPEMGTRFVMMLGVYPDNYESVLEILSRERMIKEVHVISGNDLIMAEGVYLYNASFNQLINRLYRQNGKVIKSISTYIIMSTVKDEAAGIRYEHMKAEEGKEPEERKAPEAEKESADTNK
ncbi:MAG: Lrp/AsnC family transcriptional regulator [Lachnospiraceae bacterium]|nr:Lrp/AsnC family transcriptional regulator [Lachnospiraceae bacterium]